MSGEILSGELFFKVQNIYSPVLIGYISAMNRTQNDTKFIAASGFSEFYVFEGAVMV